jgi:hypothetical protein
VEKKRYYITLQGGTTTAEIRDVRGESTYDFEIEADPVEIGLLRDMLIHAVHADFLGWMHSHIPFTNLHDLDNEAYDDNLVNIYRKIYQLGTPDTRAKIEQMGLVERLKLNRDGIHLS